MQEKATQTILSLERKTLEPALRALAQEHFGLPVQVIRCLGGGSYGLAFYVQMQGKMEPVVLKAFRCPGMQDTQAFELELLRENTSVAMPRVLFTHEPDALCDAHVLGMELIAGKNALMPACLLHSKKRRAVFAEQVVEGMLPWHSTHGTAFGLVQNPQCGSWQAFYKPMALGILDEMREQTRQGRFQAEWFETLERATADFDVIFRDQVEKPCLIHGDLNAMNMMADPRTLRLTGFIDPFHSMWADAEYDLFHLRTLIGDWYPLFETYRRHARLSQLCEVKCAYYAMMNEAMCFLRSGNKVSILFRQQNRRLKRCLREYNIR